MQATNDFLSPGRALQKRAKKLRFVWEKKSIFEFISLALVILVATFVMWGGGMRTEQNVHGPTVKEEMTSNKWNIYTMQRIGGDIP